MKRIVFAGGGTGGHVYMAVAIAQELSRQMASIRFLFIGTRSGLESRIVPELGFTLETIEIGGLKNVGLVRTVRSLLQIPVSLLKSLRLIRSFRPDITVGVGGYASGPVILASWMLRIPSVIIEPNVLPGFTNRLLSPLVRGAMVAFPETAEWFGDKARRTGIPIRQEFYELRKEVPGNGPLRLLIFGGSQGSRPINQLLIGAAPYLARLDLRIVHQTGPADLERVREAYRQEEIQAEVTEYIDRMPRAFSEADLVISRSGASTIAEITAASLPAILIPLPHAADDHQKKNAEALVRRGAAIMMEQHRTDGESLASKIEFLVGNRRELEKMSRAGRALARPESTREIVEFIKEVAA